MARRNKDYDVTGEPSVIKQEQMDDMFRLLFEDLVDISAGIPDIDTSHFIRLITGSDLTANRTLSFDIGDADRVLTINGDATLDDWFDQSVKAADSPSFNDVLLADFLQFTSTSAPATPGAGIARMYAETHQGHTHLHVVNEQGQNFQLSRDLTMLVRNTSGGSITKGQAVDIYAATGGVAEVRLADADASPPRHCEGFALEDMSNNAYGMIVLTGNVDGIDTSSFAEGAQLYLSTTAGAVSTTAPTSGLVQIVGIVTRSHATQGSIEAIIALPTSNKLLDASAHIDTVAGTVVRGDLIIGNSTPAWARVALGSKGAVLRSDGTDATWGAVSAEQTTTSTGTQNDFDITVGRHAFLRCNNASALVFTGFTVNGAAPQEGDRITIDNIGSSTVRVAHQDAGSTAANRVISESTRGQILGANGRMELVYDTTSDRWRLALLAPGAPISVAFSASDYTGDGVGGTTVTVESGDVLAHTYVQYGTILEIVNTVSGFTVATATTSLVRVALPNGFVSKTGLTQTVPMGRANDNVTWRPAMALGLTAGTVWAVFFIDGTSWAIGTNNQHYQGSFRLQID